MYASRIVEYATVEELFDNPQHPYTEGLFRSVPKLGARGERLDTIPGTVPNPARFPTGCKFHPRCPRTRQAAQTAGPADDHRNPPRWRKLPESCDVCAQEEPVLREVKKDHWAACHLIDSFKSAPITAPVLRNRRQVVPRASRAAIRKFSSPLKRNIARERISRSRPTSLSRRHASATTAPPPPSFRQRALSR